MEKILQITSGRGPAECTWVLAQLLKKILIEARSVGINAIVLDKVNGDLNRTLQSATIQLKGDIDKLGDFVKPWIGTIQWIGKSKYRKYHKRKNWFVGVKELEISASNLTIKDSEIKYEATRAGGPGGQHVNKVSTAIRATHVPSGISVLASDNRSQLQNKKHAKERLKKMLQIKKMENQLETIKSNWQNHNELERGNPIRVFRGSDFKSSGKPRAKKYDRKGKKQELKRNNYDE